MVEVNAVLPVVMEVSPSKNNVIPRNFIVNGSGEQASYFCLGVVNKMSASTMYGACADWNACITILTHRLSPTIGFTKFFECTYSRSRYFTAFHSLNDLGANSLSKIRQNVLAITNTYFLKC